METTVKLPNREHALFEKQLEAMEAIHGPLKGKRMEHFLMKLFHDHEMRIQKLEEELRTLRSSEYKNHKQLEDEQR